MILQVLFRKTEKRKLYLWMFAAHSDSRTGIREEVQVDDLQRPPISIRRLRDRIAHWYSHIPIRISFASISRSYASNRIDLPFTKLSSESFCDQIQKEFHEKFTKCRENTFHSSHYYIVIFLSYSNVAVSIALTTNRKCTKRRSEITWRQANLILEIHILYIYRYILFVVWRA